MSYVQVLSTVLTKIQFPKPTHRPFSLPTPRRHSPSCQCSRPVPTKAELAHYTRHSRSAQPRDCAALREGHTARHWYHLSTAGGHNLLGCAPRAIQSYRPPISRCRRSDGRTCYCCSWSGRSRCGRLDRRDGRRAASVSLRLARRGGTRCGRRRGAVRPS